MNSTDITTRPQGAATSSTALSRRDVFGFALAAAALAATRTAAASAMDGLIADHREKWLAWNDAILAEDIAHRAGASEAERDAIDRAMLEAEAVTEDALDRLCCARPAHLSEAEARFSYFIESEVLDELGPGDFAKIAASFYG